MLESLKSLPGMGFLPSGRSHGKKSNAPVAAATAPKPTVQPEKVSTRRRMAMRPPSFTELLPYVSFATEEQVFVMKDGQTLGMLFELTPVATEAQPESYLLERAMKVQEALQAIPEVDGRNISPWIVQFFVSDDRNIVELKKTLESYILSQHKDDGKGQAILESAFTQFMLDEIEQHLVQVSRPQGLFHDKVVTGQVWRGQRRRVRCCIYRRFRALSEEINRPVDQMESVAGTLMATMHEAGIAARRCNGKDFYDWMMPFFNPGVPWAPTEAQLLEMAPYPGDRPQTPMFDWDLAESLTLSPPRSDMDAGLWEFNGKPVKAITLQNLRRQPSIGHFTAELENGKERFARFDRLPAGSMLSISITVTPQYLQERHVERIRDASRAKTAIAQETHHECEQVLKQMAVGDKLLPMMLTLYVRGESHEDINASINEANALLLPSGLRFIDQNQDLVPLDTFIRALPFNFDPAFDARALRRSRLTFASHIAALLPVYGRSRGSEHPGMWFWNRGGEPLWMDPLNKYDRKKNAHMLVLGPTGAGKSATLNYQCMMTMALHRPRLVIVDAGKSFDLLMQFFKAKGLSTHSVQLSMENDVSLPPFVHAYRLLQDVDVMESFHAAERQARANAGLVEDDMASDALARSIAQAMADDQGAIEPEGESESEEADQRDYLGEMLIAAIMMITGGEQMEVERMTRADRYLVTRAIIKAAIRAQQEQRPHPLTQDVALELMSMGTEKTLSMHRQARAEEMGQSMMSFAQGLRGKLFNRLGTDWPDADVTLVEMGTLTRDGYNDALSVAYASLIDSVQSRAERAQAEDRPIIMLTDEAHMITTNELLGPKIARGTKMWRKLNAWFWMATQNVKDFPDNMERVLSMCEFWMLLTMDKSEIVDVHRFRSITPEQRAMMESARKETPKYTEGVLLNAMGQFLFRNVPPALPIALAMTEGHEKAARRRIMEHSGCTELEAAIEIARQLAESRN